MAACRLLGVEVVGEPVVLPSEFPAWTKSVDLLLRVGPGRLAHVEYARRGERDLVARMMMYRCLIMRDYPDDVLGQHIIVLGGGRVEGHEDPVRTGFWLDLNVVYLRDVDPEWFLGGPELAPLAVLGRGGREVRERACGRALRLIHQAGGVRTEDLLDFTCVLATIILDRDAVQRILKEVGMTMESIAEFYRDTDLGHVLQDVGRKEGRKEGRQEGREAALVEAITDRFGPDPGVPVIAHRLAGWSVGAFHAVIAAASLADLAVAEPPA